MIDITIIGISILAVYIFYFIWFRFGYVICDSNVCLNGKTALVTGGSSGLGYQIALSLASRGCRVVIADKVINEDIKKSIVGITNNPNIILEYADFASFKSVRELAKKLNDSEEKLDILINNVGVGKSLDFLSEDGHNLTMQINYYSPFLVTHLLTDLLRKSKSGRIVFTSSVASFFHLVTPDSVTPTNLQKLPDWSSAMNYSNSKFATIVASDIFAAKLKKWNITCNAYHPGVANTNIWNASWSNMNWWNVTDIIIYIIMNVIAVSYGIHPKFACQPALILAISKEYENVTGTFSGKYFPTMKPRGSNDIKLCNGIWRTSENIVKLQTEEILA